MKTNPNITCCSCKEEEMPTLAVCRVTNEERDEIKSLFLRKEALCDLFVSMPALNEETNVEELYNKIVKEQGEISFKYQRWWIAISKKYALPENVSFRVEFESCQLFPQ